MASASIAVKLGYVVNILHIFYSTLLGLGLERIFMFGETTEAQGGFLKHVTAFVKS